MSNENTLVNKILKTIRNFSMLKSGDSIVIALSGGPDSVFLFHILNKLRKKLNIELLTLHINHLARGEESEKDAVFCRKLASSMNTEFVEVIRDVPGYARKNKISFEEAGRKIRLKVFKEIMETTGARKVATGHTADDQAETVLMKFINGSGIPGLAGIYPVYENFLIRPLLDVSKQEILDYLDENNIQYRIDLSNKDTDFFRNKIRNQLMPLLKKEYNCQIQDALCRTASIFREQALYLNARTDFFINSYVQINKNSTAINTKHLASLPSFVVRHILREMVKLVKGDLHNITFTHTENLFKLLEKPGTSSIQLPGRITARKEYNHLIIEKNSKRKINKPEPASIKMPGEWHLKGLGLNIKGEILEKPVIPQDRSKNIAYLDFDRLEEDFIIRSLEPGDRFSPLGVKGEKKLKDFLIDEKIPLGERDLVPLLVNRGRIVWVMGLRISESFKVDSATSRIIKIEFGRF